MIAGCIERAGRNGCDGCQRRDACAALFAGLFGTPRRRPPARDARPPSRQTNPFLDLIGRVARAIEEGRRAGKRETEARERQVRARPTGFRREVEHYLEPLLASGTIRMEQVARAMRCSRQTLYRRLKAEGATFEQVLEELRRRLALRYVREEGLSVKEAAYRLGFSDPAAFSRAFKRWTGVAPRELRGKRPH
ncbi:MAG: helix-turn-helix transcriptional regulator [Sphingomonadaceae bacterium]|nr:helix-turn-helix transcriptional regulator [Sphingomonadaceae bacterium]